MRRSTLFWGVVLILIGIALLAGNLFEIDIWDILWPALLILFGIWVLFGAFFRGRRAEENITVPLDGAIYGRVQINHGAGRLQLRSGSGFDDLLNGTFGGGLDYKHRKLGETVEVDLSVPMNIWPFGWSPGDGLTWDVRLNNQVPLMLNLNTGAGEVRADLSDLKVTDLTLKTGASSSEIVFPANAGMTRAKIESGAASVDIRIPHNVAARIHASGGLSSIDVDGGRFTSQGGNVYLSPEYESAQNKVELVVTMGVGSVTIR